MRFALLATLLSGCRAACMLPSATEPSTADCQTLCDAGSCGCSAPWSVMRQETVSTGIFDFYDWAADEQRHHLDANCRLDDGKGHARTIATLIDEQHAIIAEGSRSERLTSERTSERQDVAPPVAPVAPPPRTAAVVEDDPPKRISVKDRLAMFGG